MNSQNDEEVLIKRFFKNHIGTVLDIGANDGITLSNSWSCIQRGWSATLVEPSPTAFDRLMGKHQLNPLVQMLNVAIGDKSGTMPLHENVTHLRTGDVALLSTLIPEERAKWEKDGNPFITIECEVRTWPEVLEESKLKTFDLITIDAEGNDWIILKQMDLDALQCRMLIVEHEHLDANMLEAHCAALGFALLSKNRQNLVMVR